MSGPPPLELAAYVTAPRLSVSSAVALGIALLAASPKPRPQAVHRAASRLREAVVELQQQWRQHADSARGLAIDPRNIDTRVDRAFRALAISLEAIAILPPDAGPDVETARNAQRRLFPEGTRFLNLPYAQQWAHCDRMLSTLAEDEALRADVERLVHTSILTEARSAMEAYGVALGITKARPSSAPVSLAGPLDAVRSAIVAYALQLVAMQSDDPSRLPTARRALAPIDELRAAQARRGQGRDASSAEPPGGDDADAGTVTPETPIPAVDDAPETTHAVG
ncbi:hypothetical protein [Paraliomyxa miuraensis]|uniref:hypothetical protein n=1 Tax=Paraliomyxa miuraensis TaxID=376150 RepID=UPI0022561D11|nr:hypothetical protein [Paraliomyxa miuraensis]MCX4245954.1 hypothetical protein [Paraliomyxa miuraensis]